MMALVRLHPKDDVEKLWNSVLCFAKRPRLRLNQSVRKEPR